MNTFQQDSANCVSAPKVHALRTLTPEERLTQRRWARAVLGLYCSLFLLGGIAVHASHSGANSNSLVAQAAASRPAR